MKRPLDPNKLVVLSHSEKEVEYLTKMKHFRW